MSSTTRSELSRHSVSPASPFNAISPSILFLGLNSVSNQCKVEVSAAPRSQIAAGELINRTSVRCESFGVVEVLVAPSGCRPTAAEMASVNSYSSPVEVLKFLDELLQTQSSSLGNQIRPPSEVTRDP